MIPPVAHFVWFGRDFPWLNVLAILSAARSGGFQRVVLHLDGSRESVLKHEELARLPQFELRTINLPELALGSGFDAAHVQTLFQAMSSAAARSDVVRALVLLIEGGVYLDTDTVTVRSFTSLLASASAFIGQERICFPGWNATPPSLAARAKSYALAALRWTLSVLPRGYRTFAKLAPSYSLWANNAVMGCEPGHPFMRNYVSSMLSMPLDRACRPYGVGPDLLQRVYDGYSNPEHRVRCMEPEAFYPLAPVISDHWWKTTQNPRISDVLSPETLVVHWYASVRNRKRIACVNARYVTDRAHNELFSSLVALKVHDS